MSFHKLSTDGHQSENVRFRAIPRIITAIIDILSGDFLALTYAATAALDGLRN